MQKAATGCASTKRCIPTGRVFRRYEIFLPKIELKKKVAKTSFLPNFSNKTTSVAKVYDANNTSLPHCSLAASLYEVNEVGLQVAYSMATEVVLFEKLGENEVAKPIDFGTNRRKKLRRFEHPALRDLRRA
ncbi:MAG: hypothetical protein LBO71_05725, partial [Prevotellaceae bacterium]|nr:hypothetical protein [Prevotellaceae bacterium]